jgi:hypothetical protein
VTPPEICLMEVRGEVAKAGWAKKTERGLTKQNVNIRTERDVIINPSTKV